MTPQHQDYINRFQLKASLLGLKIKILSPKGHYQTATPATTKALRFDFKCDNFFFKGDAKIIMTAHCGSVGGSMQRVFTVDEFELLDKIKFQHMVEQIIESKLSNKLLRKQFNEDTAKNRQNVDDLWWKL